MSARAGAPTASFDLEAIAPSTPEELALSARAGAPTASFDLEAIASVPLELAVSARAGLPTIAFNLDHPPAGPDAPTNIQVSQVGLTTALLTWDAPQTTGSGPVTDYEIQIDAGAWVSTGTSGASHLLVGLRAGTSYQIKVRAVNVEGAGQATPATTFATITPTPPALPRFLIVEPTGQTAIDLFLTKPLSDGGSEITHYQVCVILEDGSIEPFESTDDASTSWRVRGLAFGHRYGFRVRAVNSVGVGVASELMQTAVSRVTVAPVIVTPNGQLVPLIDTSRQSLILRLADQDCRVRVWWQPSDLSWWGSIEVPVNTPAVQSRRLALDAGILDRITDVLPGNLVMRELGNAGLEPDRNAWSRPTHGLFWEPRG